VVCRLSSGSAEVDSGLTGHGGDPFGRQHRRKLAKQAWQAPGRHHRYASTTTLPQGTWAPWTATIGTTATPGSGRTWAARSASNDTARRVGANG
jgi:hypothetical protein